uniref:Uncharacterized protein n=1 Tax=Sphaerodactylus townsendi TaxID=933632 RepID=A0ACB8EPW0_9SAUR
MSSHPTIMRVWRLSELEVVWSAQQEGTDEHLVQAHTFIYKRTHLKMQDDDFCPFSFGCLLLCFGGFPKVQEQLLRGCGTGGMTHYTDCFFVHGLWLPVRCSHPG